MSTVKNQLNKTYLLACFALVIILSFSSCLGKKKTLIEGYVYTAGTTDPVENARVYINLWYATDILSGGHRPLDTIYTDANGYFRWESDIELGKKEWILLGFIGHDRHFALDASYAKNGMHVLQGDHLRDNFYMTPHAYIHLKVEDVPEVEGSFCRVWSSDVWGIDDLYGNSHDKIHVVEGNKLQYVSWKYNLVPNVRHIDSLYIPAFDTLVYEIQY